MFNFLKKYIKKEEATFDWFLGKCEKKEEPTIDWGKFQFFNDLQCQQYDKYLKRENSFELAPRQSGKTFFGSYISTKEAMATPETLILCLGANMSQTNHFWCETGDFIKAGGMENIKLKFNSLITFPNRSTITFKSIDSYNPDCFRGRNIHRPYSLVFYDEYDFANRSILSRYLRDLNHYDMIDKNTLHMGLSTGFFTERFSI
tara:strand:- start:20 stop:628 length:609 start_codon:yes stop_codon:yes gene_type:complete